MQQTSYLVEKSIASQNRCPFCSDMLLESSMCRECKEFISCICIRCGKKTIVDFHVLCFCSPDIILGVIESYTNQLLMISSLKYDILGITLDQIKNK